MDQELQKLIHRLQDEKCPPTVLDRVARHISQERTPARSLPSSLVWAVSIAGLVGAVALWQWQARREAQLLAAELAAAQARANRALVVQQTHEAFDYVGQALIRAVAHTETVLSKEAVPPLRNSFETVKNKITRPI
jgi:anti-sigma factor RsiW